MERSFFFFLLSLPLKHKHTTASSERLWCSERQSRGGLCPVTRATLEPFYTSNTGHHLSKRWAFRASRCSFSFHRSAVDRKAGEQREEGTAGYGAAHHVWGGRPGGIERPASLVSGPPEPEEVVPAGGGGPLPTADGRLAPSRRMLPGGAEAKTY